MGAITGTYGLVSYQTLAVRLAMDDVTSTVTNTNLLTTSGFAALVPKGPLNTFLTTVFGSNAAAELAFRAIGGRFEIRRSAGTAVTVVSAAWTFEAATGPSLSLAGGSADTVLEVRIVVPHSIVQ